MSRTRPAAPRNRWAPDPLRTASALITAGAVVTATAAIGAVAARVGIVTLTRSRVVSLDRALTGGIGRWPATTRPPAVVLGAGLRPDGSPSGVLARRVEAAVALHRAGLVGQLVMSGADDANGDQPGAMRDAALGAGVSPLDVSLDPTGIDTAATCRQARAIVGDDPLVLVTQAFHANRTAYLAMVAGLDAVVVATADADIRTKARWRGRLREIPAAVKATSTDRRRLR